MSTKMRGNFLLAITALVWGISFVSQSIGMDYIGANTFNGIRTLLGGLVLLPVILITDAGKKKKGTYKKCNFKKLLLYGAVCGVLLCVASTLQSLGLKETTAGKSGFITALYIIFVSVMGIFAGRKLNLKIVSGVLLAVLGMYFLCLFGAEINFCFGDFLTFLCAIVFSFHILVIDRVAPKTDGVKLACTQFFVCGLLNCIAMFLFESPDWALIKQCIGAILYSGIMSCGVAYTLQIVGQKYTDPTSASMLMSLESVFAVLSGWILLGERMNVPQTFGCTLMFAAIVLVQLPERAAVLKNNKEMAENDI